MQQREQPYEALFTLGEQRIHLWQLRVTYPAFGVLFLLLLATGALWWLVRSQIRSEQQALFERAVSSVMNRLERQVDQYEQVLRSVQGLYATVVQVVRDVFELYATVPARSNLAILWVAYAPCVEHSQLGAYLHYARSERYWDYRLFPAATQPYLFPLLYVVPVEIAPRWIGWNVASHPAWQGAVERAYLTGALGTTPWIPLQTEPDTIWGFALVAPLYRGQPHPFSRLQVGQRFVEGVAIIAVDGNAFFRQALAVPAPTDSLIWFEGYDVQSAPDGGMRRIRIVESPNRSVVGAGYAPALWTERELRIGDRRLLFSFATVPNFEGVYQRWVPWLVLGGGVLTSVIAFAFVLSLVTTRARALALAEQMTRAQRRILEASHDIIALWELDGRWRTSNPAVREILGYAPAELGGMAVEALLPEEYRQQFRQYLASAPEEEPVVVELPMQTKDGQWRWVGWNLTVSRRDGLIYAIGRDITAQKELQRQQEIVRRRLLLSEQWALEANEFKAEFLQRLSFQLRNGLTALMGFAELIAQRNYGSEQELESYADAIRESAEYLLSLVEEAPEVAATTVVERRPLPLQPIVAAFLAEARQQGLQVTVSGSPAEASVLAAEGLVEEALRALLRGIALGCERAEAMLRIEVSPAEGNSEWTLAVPASEKLCRAAALIAQSSPLEALARDESEGVFSFLLAQSLLRRLHGELRLGCVEGEFVAVFTLPVERRLDISALRSPAV